MSVIICRVINYCSNTRINYQLVIRPGVRTVINYQLVIRPGVRTVINHATYNHQTVKHTKDNHEDSRDVRNCNFIYVRFQFGLKKVVSVRTIDYLCNT